MRRGLAVKGHKAMLRRRAVVFLLIIVLMVGAEIFTALAQQPQPSKVIVSHGVVLEIAAPWDTIDSGVAECVVDAVRFAENNGYALILKVDSYGGYLDAAFSIGDTLYNARVPVIAYVENKGLSAATLIILPADVIAVKKGAVIGAMKPVMINPATGEVTFINESKVVEPIVSKARVYAERRGRNTTLVAEFVYKARTVTSSEAVRLGVADYEVQSLDELLDRVRGLDVERGGSVYRLNITSVEMFTCSLRSRFLSLLSNSYLSNILLSIGVLAAIFALAAGKLVALPLALTLIFLGLIGGGLNPNIVSLILIVLGATLLAVELFVVPGFGVLGVSGVVMIVLGFALLPMYIPAGAFPPEEYITILRAFIFGVAIVLGTFFGIVLLKTVQTLKQKPISFTPEGKTGVAVDEIKPGSIGFVKIEGEYWRATADTEIKPGEEVVIVRIREDGVLIVKKKE
jgi:membrane-bound serine protease (ClpP class)